MWLRTRWPGSKAEKSQQALATPTRRRLDANMWMRRARRRTASLWEGCPIWAPLLSNPRRSTPTSRGFTPSWHGAATGRRARGQSLTDRRHAKLSSGLEARGSELGCLGGSKLSSGLEAREAWSSELGARGSGAKLDGPKTRETQHGARSSGLGARAPGGSKPSSGLEARGRGARSWSSGLEAGAQGSKLGGPGARHAAECNVDRPTTHGNGPAQTLSAGSGS